MPEYLLRDALIDDLMSYSLEKAVEGQYDSAVGIMLSAGRVRGFPAADVVAVVHGRWVDKMVRDWHCSECGKKLTGHGWDGYCYKDLPLYCPNCGAKMDGGDAECP